VDVPLSLDVMVWPSLFDWGQGIGFSAAERERLRLSGIPLPAWTGPFAVLWDSLPVLTDYLGLHVPEDRPRLIIAVTKVAIGAESLPHEGKMLQAADQSGWTDGRQRRLGFDVADGYGVSGLSNCGYADEELETYRSRWSGFLNAFHLFEGAAQALEFASDADHRISSHAPFSAYGLYLVSGGLPGLD
jgi:hypothetical protein